VPEAGFIVPQAPAGVPLTVKVTVSPVTDNPLNVVTVTVKLWVLEPVARMGGGEAGLKLTTFTGAVWVMEIVVLAPEPASVAVMVQVPTVVVGPYVIVATPLAFVEAVCVDPAQFVPLAKATVSPPTTTPLAFLTVALTDEVAELSAGILVGLAAPVMVFPVPLVWVMVTLPLPPVPAGVPVPLSVAVIAQNPLVVLEM
jgi:hypothetical protein